MKKTIILFSFIFMLTTVLFASGLVLLALVEQADTAIDDQMFDNDVPHSFAQMNASVINIIRSFKSGNDVPINVLVLVTDGSNTDAMIVVHYNPNNYNIGMLSIPRDTYVTIPGMSFHKINAVYSAKSGGIDKLKAALADMLGQDVDYYICVNLKTVNEVVDLLDGVYYTVPCDMIYDDPTQKLHINIKKGRQLLDGKQVEGLLRFRHPNSNGWTNEIKKYYDGGDLRRIERQKDFINEALSQKLTMANIPKINKVIENVYSNVKTDLTLQEILKLVKGIPNINAENILSETLPGEAKYIDKLSYFVHYSADSLSLAEKLLGDAQLNEPDEPQ